MDNKKEEKKRNMHVENHTENHTENNTEAHIPEAGIDAKNEEENSVRGIVTDCEILNVRSEANLTSTPVTTIKAGEQVMIDMDLSNDEFYKVYTAAGAEGYCKKEYIKVQN